ncbi:hypothetical protein BDD12DRAFT_898498 [Trichophaea hybrida]|nr:hypothetical protein BDD12DRAFT_898498 [Trichophaea hybrida]
MRTLLKFPFLTFLALLLAVCLVSSIPTRCNIGDRDLLFERSAQLVPPLVQQDGCNNNGCACAVGAAQGQYCYNCETVLYLGDTSVWSGDYTKWVYECNPREGVAPMGTERAVMLRRS